MFKSVTLPVRRAVYQALKDNVTYMGVVIPVWEEYANGKQAVLTVGVNSPVTCWIRLINQTEDDNSPKCLRNSSGSIQVQVQTSFNANSGNSVHSEEIMNLILGILFPAHDSSSVSLPDPFKLWEFKVTSFPNIPVIESNTNRIWVKQAVIEYQVSQSES